MVQDGFKLMVVKVYCESMAGSVIQATGTVEFEDGLKMGVLPGGCLGP